MSVRVRFAPGTAGPLHLGHVRTALVNWLLARKRGGQFLLRIEDTDPPHGDPAAVVAILEDLRWLGLTWDEEVVRQSERGARYRAAAERLLERGAAHRAPGPAGEGPTVRFTMPPHPANVHDIVRGTIELPGAGLDDIVLLHPDGTASSALAAVVDDGAMRVTHVVRDDEHLPQTARDVALARALGLPVPAFAHLPVIHGPDGQPLGKRHGAVAVSEYREAGYMPEALLDLVLRLGWSPPPGQPEVLEPGALLRLFSLDRVARAPVPFDPERLAWLNRQHLRRASPERLAGLLGVVPEPAVLRGLEVARRGASTLVEVREALGQLCGAPGGAAIGDPAARQLLEALRAALRDDLESAPAAVAALEEASRLAGVGRRAAMQALRLALTGERHGPAAASLLWALGTEEARRRIDRALGSEGP